MFTIKSDFKNPQQIFQIECICIYYSLDISQLQRNYNLTKSKSTLMPEWATISLSEWLRYKNRHQMLATCEQVKGRMPPEVRWIDIVTLEHCSSLLTLLSIYTVWLHLWDYLLNKNASICIKGTLKNLHGSSVLLSSKRNKPASIKNRTHKLAVAHPVQCNAARKSPEYWNAHNGRLQPIWSWVQEFGHKAILVYLKSQKRDKMNSYQEERTWLSLKKVRTQLESRQTRDLGGSLGTGTLNPLTWAHELSSSWQTYLISNKQELKAKEGGGDTCL